MKKIIDFIAPSGSGKDAKLINYIRENYLRKNIITNVCFVYGKEDNLQNHVQPTADELRKIVFETNSKDTIYFLGSFYFDQDRNNYLKLMEDMCENDIQVFKTDQIKEHITDDTKWVEKYCKFITIEEL